MSNITSLFPDQPPKQSTVVNDVTTQVLDALAFYAQQGFDHGERARKAFAAIAGQATPQA